MRELSRSLPVVLALTLFLVSALSPALAATQVQDELARDAARFQELAAAQPPDYLGGLDILAAWRGRAQGPLSGQCDEAASALGLLPPGATSFSSVLDSLTQGTYRQAATAIVEHYGSLVASGDNLGAARYAGAVRTWLDGHPTVRDEFAAAIGTKAGAMRDVILTAENNQYTQGISDLVSSCQAQFNAQGQAGILDDGVMAAREATASAWRQAVDDLKRSDPAEYRRLSAGLACGNAAAFVKALEDFNARVREYHDLVEAGKFEEARALAARVERAMGTPPTAVAQDLARCFLEEGVTMAELCRSGVVAGWTAEFERDLARYGEFVKGGRYDLAEALVEKWRKVTAANEDVAEAISEHWDVADLDAAFDQASATLARIDAGLLGEDGKLRQAVDDRTRALGLFEDLERAAARGDHLGADAAAQDLLTLYGSWVAWAQANPELAEHLGHLLGGDLEGLQQGMSDVVDRVAQIDATMIAAHPEQAGAIYRSWDRYLASHPDAAALIEEARGDDGFVEAIHAAAYPDDEGEGDQDESRQTDTSFGFTSN